MTRSGFVSVLLFIVAFPSYAQINVKDSLALVALYNNTNGPSWTVHTNWLIPDSTVSTWTGVSVTGNRVTQIQLPANGLSGTIPTLIDSLTSLTNLNVSNNTL